MPFTPKAGENVSMLASFVDIQTDKLIEEDLIVKVRIAKLGEGRSERKFLFEKEDLIAKGGILEFQYIFNLPLPQIRKKHIAFPIFCWMFKKQTLKIHSFCFYLWESYWD